MIPNTSWHNLNPDWSQTNQQIAYQLGKSIGAVAKRRRILALPKQPRGNTLTYDQNQIIERVRSGETVLQVAKSIGKSRRQVQRIIHNQPGCSRMERYPKQECPVGRYEMRQRELIARVEAFKTSERIKRAKVDLS